MSPSPREFASVAFVLEVSRQAHASGIAVDEAGNAYITGRTESPDLPTANGFQAAYGGGSGDAFLIKLSP